MESSKIIESSQLKDHITVFDSILDTELCDRIVSEYMDSTEWTMAQTHSEIHWSDSSGKRRNCKIIPISQRNKWEYNYDIKKELDDLIFKAVGKIIKSVCKKYPSLSITSDTGYDLLRYDTGGFFKLHTDASSKSLRDRVISCAIILNDDFEGGEFKFFEGNLSYSLKKGSAIVFPSNFMFPHEVAEVTQGVRYSIITWFT